MSETASNLNGKSPELRNRVAVEGRSSRPTAPKLRDATIEDYGRISQLASRHGMPLESYEQWKRLWVRNPAYTAEIPIGWVLDNKEEIVGWFANVPLHYHLNGNLIRSVTPRSWVVDEPFRAHAVLLADAFFHQKNVDLALSTTGNDKSSPVFAALGGVPVPQSLKREAAFWITDYAGFSAAYLRWKNVPRKGVLNYPLAGALALKDILLNPQPGNRPAQRGSLFGCEYDEFWRELKSSSTYLIGRRDAAALNWHFEDALRSGSAWLFESRRGSRITAYGVFLRYDHPFVGLKRMVLADYQQTEAGEMELKEVLRAALLQARCEHIHTVEISGSRLEQSDSVQKLAPHKRAKSNQSMAYQYKASADWEQMLAGEAIWDLTFFDGDSSLSPRLLGESIC